MSVKGTWQRPVNKAAFDENWERTFGVRRAKLLTELKVARERLTDARKMICTCSGFVIQYEGGCQCARSRAIESAEIDVRSATEKIID